MKVVATPMTRMGAMVYDQQGEAEGDTAQHIGEAVHQAMANMRALGRNPINYCYEVRFVEEKPL